jgi:hypothetical protein
MGSNRFSRPVVTTPISSIKYTLVLGLAFSARSFAIDADVHPSVTTTFAPLFCMKGSTTPDRIVCPSDPAQNCTWRGSPSKRRCASAERNGLATPAAAANPPSPFSTSLRFSLSAMVASPLGATANRSGRPVRSDLASLDHGPLRRRVFERSPTRPGVTHLASTMKSPSSLTKFRWTFRAYASRVSRSAITNA